MSILRTIEFIITKESTMRCLSWLPVFILAVPGMLGLTLTASANDHQSNGRRASVRVLMPAGARLTVNGKAAEKRNSRRFVTPPLEEGQKFHCVLKAELTR